MDQLKIYFDPRCVWCCQTTRWARLLEEAGVVELDWGLYSLEVQNLNKDVDPALLADRARSAPALRSAWVMMQERGSKSIGPFYRALSARTWETDEPVQDLRQAVVDSVVEAGFPATLVDDAMEDSETWSGVLAQHRGLLEERKAIGVPTISLDGDAGPIMFGPIITELPDAEAAVELWDHVSWLLRYRNFAELKRTRVGMPNLPGQNIPEERRPWGGRTWVTQMRSGGFAPT